MQRSMQPPTGGRFSNSLAEWFPHVKKQMTEIWFVDVCSHESVRCVICVFSLFFPSMRLPMNLFVMSQPPLHRGRCSTGLWKLLLETCRTQLGPKLSVVFSYMGLNHPNGVIWEYHTLSNLMAWIVTSRHFLSFDWNSHFGVYGRNTPCLLWFVYNALTSAASSSIFHPNLRRLPIFGSTVLLSTVVQ